VRPHEVVERVTLALLRRLGGVRNGRLRRLGAELDVRIGHVARAGEREHRASARDQHDRDPEADQDPPPAARRLRRHAVSG
jgi:hypothetical protein